MANNIRSRFNFVSGTLTVTLASGDTTMTSPGLSNLGVIDSTNYCALTIENEIVWVTAHTASSSTATIVRGQEGTLAAAHGLVGWQHSPTAQDFHSYSLGTQTTPQGSPSSASDIANGFGSTETTWLSTTAIPTIAGRRYGISGYLTCGFTGGNQFQIYIRRGVGTGGTLLSIHQHSGSDSVPTFCAFHATDIPGVQTAQQWSVNYFMSTGTGDLRNPSLLVVEDIGADTGVN